MDLERVLAGLREAAEIANGYVPTDDDLSTAPLIASWAVVLPGPCLAGRITGHPDPNIRGPVSVTSVVLAIDPAAEWARTVNRYYRLGVPYGEHVQ
jgi:hypothetical protein